MLSRVNQRKYSFVRGFSCHDAKVPVNTMMLDKSNIKVYPNPVRPEFNGVLAVSGLTANADVRIVNTAGHVVAGGRSVGGTFTWDLRGTDGFRVPSGVYDIMVVTNEANKGIVAKVTII